MTVTYEHFLSAWAEALYWRLEYMDSNPDVGFGPFPNTVLAEMLARNKQHISEEDKKKVLDRVKRRRK